MGTEIAGLYAISYNVRMFSSEEELFIKEIVLRFQEWKGHKHPKTISAKANLASVYEDQKRFDIACQLREEVTKDRTEVFGEGDGATTWAKFHLASTYLARDDLDNDRAFSTLEALYSELHSSTDPNERELAMECLHMQAKALERKRSARDVERVRGRILHLRAKGDEVQRAKRNLRPYWCKCAAPVEAVTIPIEVIEGPTTHAKHITAGQVGRAFNSFKERLGSSRQSRDPGTSSANSNGVRFSITDALSQVRHPGLYPHASLMITRLSKRK